MVAAHTYSPVRSLPGINQAVAPSTIEVNKPNPSQSFKKKGFWHKILGVITGVGSTLP
jgi:hypothetical protein